jgi:N-acetylglucosamine-6-sulfatase
VIGGGLVVYAARVWLGRRRRSRWATSLGALMAFIASVTFTPSLPGAHAATTRGKPNIVIIITDDQRWDTVTARYMPKLTRLLVPKGVSFTRSFASNPACCPSRVTTLTGKYSFTTGVYGNRGTWGGYGASVRYGAMNDTLATDLRSDGYTTALVGKYLNGYGPRTDYPFIPPGWDRWFAVKGGSYYDYYAAVDSAREHFGDRPDDYSTTVLQSEATSFIDAASISGTPFFLYFAPTVPHAPAIADPRDVGRFDVDVRSYVQPPSVPEPDDSDKPAYIQATNWSPSIQARRDAFHARQLAAIYGADRAIGAIWKALPTDTVVLFMSDNGFAWGEHGWAGKMVPYNESLRVPMLIASKGVNLSSIGPVGGSSDRLALNVDVRSTLESFVRGLPQQSLTDGEPWTGSAVRRDFPIMHWDGTNEVPVYCGIRSRRWMYVRYADGFEEAYDERADPFELNNRAVTHPMDPALPTLRARATTYCAQRSGRVYPDRWPF